MANMGIGNIDGLTFKRKFRWGISIDSVTSSDQALVAPNITNTSQSLNFAKLLPPEKFNRPKISIKDFSVNHLSETVSYPDKVEWQPISLTLYDVSTSGGNLVYNWIKEFYDLSYRNNNSNNNGQVLTMYPAAQKSFLKLVEIYMYTGNGCVLEKWTLENAFPSDVSWGDLDYSSSAYCTIDVTIKYHRAFYTEYN